jgi:TRAP-type C4-dicarboxylate transport system permease small subunit
MPAASDRSVIDDLPQRTAGPSQGANAPSGGGEPREAGSVGEPKIMGEDGQFHAQDEAVDLFGTPYEGWVALAFFWALGLTVFYQFFTRYVMNDSASWTEEIARYLLIAVVFIGAAIGVAKNNHIQVDFFYRHMPAAMSKSMSRLVDVIRVLFFAAAVVLTVQMMLKLGNARMTIIDLPMNIVYGICLLGFAAMFVRSIRVARVHWKQGYSVLERP